MERTKFHSDHEAIQAALNQISELIRRVDSLIIESHVLRQRNVVLMRALLIDAKVDADRLKRYTSISADGLDKSAAEHDHPDAARMLRAIADGVRESLSEIDLLTSDHPAPPKLTLIPGGKSEE